MVRERVGLRGEGADRDEDRAWASCPLIPLCTVKNPGFETTTKGLGAGTGVRLVQIDFKSTKAKGTSRQHPLPPRRPRFSTPFSSKLESGVRARKWTFHLS